jgi:hypothetical protein
VALKKLKAKKPAKFTIGKENVSQACGLSIFKVFCIVSFKAREPVSLNVHELD